MKEEDINTALMDIYLNSSPRFRSIFKKYKKYVARIEKLDLEEQVLKNKNLYKKWGNKEWMSYYYRQAYNEGIIDDCRMTLLRLFPFMKEETKRFLGFII